MRMLLWMLGVSKVDRMRNFLSGSGECKSQDERVQITMTGSCGEKG